MKKHILFLLFTVCSTVLGFSQITANGVVLDMETDEPLIGASVRVLDSTNGAITDYNGEFTIEVNEGEQLVVSYIGYENQTVQALENMVIKLASDNYLNEVVVVGYETLKRSDIIAPMSQVDAREVQNIPTASVDQLLQGKATGAQVTAINGKPGGGAYIRVRGLTSINGNNEPLYIVDGIPQNSRYFSAINPSDIENIKILKDAAATSIYGARGAAGVVLVTTKNGDSEGIITFDYQTGVKDVAYDPYTLMDADTKLDYEIAAGFRQPLSIEERANLLANEVNWNDVLTRTGDNNRYNLSFAKGHENGSIYASASYFEEDGLTLASDFERLTFKANLEQQIIPKVTLNAGIGVSREEDNETRDRFNVQSPFAARFYYNSYEPVYLLDEFGNPYDADGNGQNEWNRTSQGFNVVEALQNNPSTNKLTNTTLNAGLRIEPIENLLVNIKGGANLEQSNSEYRILPGSILDSYVGDADAPGIGTSTNRHRDRYNVSTTGQYNFDLNDDSSFSALAGVEYFNYLSQSYQVGGKGYTNKLTTLDNFSVIDSGYSNEYERALYSTFGRLRYNFDDRLLASATLRRDGSSRFGEDTRFGNFYALGASYDFSSLPALEDTAVDQLKFRASHGTSGNEPTQFNAYIGAASYASYAGQVSLVQTTVANPELQWETGVNTSFGLDFGVLNNRFTGSLDLYEKTAQDLLFYQPLSLTTGFSSRLENVGELRNRGIEFELVSDILRAVDRNDVSLSLSTSISTNKAEMTEIVNENGEIDLGYMVLKEGEMAYNYRMVRFNGVDPQTGDLVYLDADGNKVVNNENTSDDDKVLLDGKSPLPKYFGNIGLNTSWKGFSLNGNLYYSGGNYILNTKKAILLGDINNVSQQQDVAVNNYWKQPGDITDIQRLGVQSESGFTSDRYLEKGDYVRLRDLRLSYSFGNDLAKRVKSKGISLFVQGTNLLTFTDFTGDPEVGVNMEESNSIYPGSQYIFSYPNAKAFTGGATIKF